MKIFLSTPISGLSIEEYESYRKTIINFIQRMRKKYEVFSEIEGIDNSNDYDSPADSIAKDLSSVKDCDIFIMHYPKKQPTSALIELGFAIAYKKNIIIITPNRSSLPYISLGIPSYCSNSYIIESEEINDTTIQKIETIVTTISQIDMSKP